ncbi:MAG: SMP-30/gluconolactonase/LRE family protein [Chloroflexi bacterium]|nr:SMP-30/gluconolactonase/LRE family protein [Chloroflexota bacterium]
MTRSLLAQPPHTSGATRPLRAAGTLVLLLAVLWAIGIGGPVSAQQAGEHRSSAPRAAPVPAVATPTPIALGQPGLSFRYVQTFGQTEVAYFEDTAYLNWPYGLGTDGTNVWIADSYGLRALKFTGDGTFARQIGRAGFRYGASGQSLDWVADVAVDSGGNVWLVDGNVHVVAKFDSSGAYVSKLGQDWTSGSDNSHFDSPHGLAFDSTGNLYVSDRDNHRVQVFTSSGAYLATIGVAGVSGSDNAHFKDPRHVAIDSADNLYVADAGNHRVQVFNASHVYVATLGVSGVSGFDSAHFNWPIGVHVDASRIYVADYNNHRVQLFDRATRAYLATLGTGSAGLSNTQFNQPTDVAVDSAGSIYVADRGNTRVQQFSSSLAYVRTYGTTGVPYLTDALHYHRPAGAAVAADGSLYLVEQRGHRLLKLDAAGAPQWTIGQAGVSGSDSAHFNEPNDVDLDAAGRAYVADSGNHRVQVFNPDGTYAATLGTGYGTGSYQFKYPNGVAVDSSGTIYVADRDNHRVQIYDSNRVYVAALGTTGLSDSDNAHFWSPWDVAVDVAGNLYVADRDNQRVQVFNSSRAYVRTIGESGVAGSDFGHLSSPYAVSVDAAGRLYVADQSGGRVQVFDTSGAYLTTIGGSGGNRTGQTRNVEGLALDSAGNLYAADRTNHRVQKYAPGVPDWVQRNLNGFGNPKNSAIRSLAPFGGQLYAGTHNSSGSGAQLWRGSGGGDWVAVTVNGFGDPTNAGIDHLVEFNGRLYAGTRSWDYATSASRGGQVWRSTDGGTWEQVAVAGFGDPSNLEVFRFAVFNNQLYAATWRSGSLGTEVWRSSSGDAGTWSRVLGSGAGDTRNAVGLAFSVFNGFLYAGTYNTTTGGEVWRTADGLAWTQVNADGFGSTNNRGVTGLAVFNGALYASTYGNSGTAWGQVWRCQACDGTDWVKVVDNGSGNLNSGGQSGLEVLGSQLYLVLGNATTGLEVWRSGTGNPGDWQQVGFAGFGDSNNAESFWDNSVAVLNLGLFIGTSNSAQGGEVWQYTAGAAPAPTVAAVTPTTGSVRGGTSVTIAGANFQAGATVAFSHLTGSLPASNVVVGSASSLTATAPRSPERYTSGALNGQLRLIGDVNGGGSVTSLDALCILRAVASLPATSSCPAAMLATTVDVVLANPDGQSGTLASGYTYRSADVNGSGSVTSLDALCTLRQVAALPATTSCPAPPVSAPAGNG